jgi:hypothetical protein
MEAALGAKTIDFIQKKSARLLLKSSLIGITITTTSNNALP